MAKHTDYHKSMKCRERGGGEGYKKMGSVHASVDGCDEYVCDSPVGVVH
jgi:hypothetical protein